MYAIVANGFQTIVQTRERLDVIISLFPYPKFQYVKTVAEGREWIRKNSRVSYTKNVTNYGETSSTGFAEIDYYISNNCLFYNIKTHRLGFVRVSRKNDFAMDQRPELIKIKVPNVVLDNMLIAHHAIAIQRILSIVGSYVDVVINVPDMSVFLAMTKYSGKNYIIKRTRDTMNKRLGSTSFTVIDGLEFNRDEFEDLFDL